MKIFNLSISEIDGVVFFSNLIQEPINHILDKSGKNSISVESIRIDTFIEKNNILPQFVKIDVEGFEYNVLLSFGKWLKLVKVFLIENNSQIVNDSINKLLSENFIGPLSFNISHSIFKKRLPNYHEDLIYIAKNFKEELVKMKFNFNEYKI